MESPKENPIQTLAQAVAEVQAKCDELIIHQNDADKRLDLYGVALVKIFEVLLKAGIIQAPDVPDLSRPGKPN